MLGEEEKGEKDGGTLGIVKRKEDDFKSNVFMIDLWPF